MHITLVWASFWPGSLRYLGAAMLCILFSFSFLACSQGSGRILELETTVVSMNESLDLLENENAELRDEVAVLSERLDDTEAQIHKLEQAASISQWLLPEKAQWSKKDVEVKEDKEETSDSEDDRSSLTQGTALQRTVNLVQESGGKIHYVDHAGRGDRTVLVMPLEFVDGQTPLIVSLHGFGGDSAYQSMYIPLHERVNSDGFALLLPNGIRNAQGSRFWNPTNECYDGGKSGEDDVAYLTELVAEAERIKDFGPIYFFGYSNGGFMSHHMACKGLPGLRAVVSLAGTSYVEASSCDGAPPVSVLHIHGTDDSVIMYEGAETGTGSGGERAFYLGAEAMVARWSQIAGCDWPEDPKPRTTLDLDQYVPGAETQVFREASSCTDGINIELWKSIGSSHAPGYGESFVDALLTWLLAQK